MSNNKKTCKYCNIEKNIDEFYVSFKTKDGNTIYKTNCKKCHKIKSTEYAVLNPSITKNIKKKYNKNNKHKIKAYTLTNSEKIKQYNKEYYSDPIKKEKQKQQVKINNKKRFKTDSNYRLTELLRQRIYHTLKNQNIKKDTHSINLIGCSISEYKQHIESQFKPEMTWENHGKVWEIDHIIPICNFDLTKEENIYKAFNYQNTQPLFKTTKIAESFGYIDQIGNRNKLKLIHG